MNDNKEKWIEQVLGSMEGSTRAVPSDQLFAKIKRGLHPKHKTIPMERLRVAVAAAALLFLLNGITIYQQFQGTSTSAETTYLENNGQNLVSNYNFYK